MKNGYPSYYPVSLNVTGRDCVVVGGGQVALRKAKALLECGAVVRVVSSAFCPGLKFMAGVQLVQLVDRAYADGDLRGAFLAIAATDDEKVNTAVAAEARARGIMVNVVDAAAQSSFILPSYLRRGGLTISVSTSGMSPALARRIRTRLEQEFGPEYEALASLIEEVRQELKGRGTRLDGDAWQEALDLDRLLDLLRNGGREQARGALLEALTAGRK